MLTVYKYIANVPGFAKSTKNCPPITQYDPFMSRL